ncbi:MAG: hypothetical protein NC828_04055, partial [Candidatus Omnitrophica bacterium]|nr:hypothetical protein [Candidatus Omnitrophota bacterium]
QLAEIVRRGEGLDIVVSDMEAQLKQLQLQLTTLQQTMKSIMGELKISFFSGYHLIVAPQDLSTNPYTTKQVR